MCFGLSQKPKIGDLKDFLGMCLSQCGCAEQKRNKKAKKKNKANHYYSGVKKAGSRKNICAIDVKKGTETATETVSLSFSRSLK